MPRLKESAKRDSPKHLRETSKISFDVELSPSLLKSLRLRGRPESKIIGEAINAAVAGWGFPHRHAGVGLRHLQKGYYECRSGLKTRLLFRATPGLLYFLMEGNHDDVRAFLKEI